MKSAAQHIPAQGKPNKNALHKSEGTFFGIQAKLTVGKPNDKFEKEADAVADKIINTPEPKQTFFGTSNFFTPQTSAKQLSKTETGEIQKQEETEEIQEKPVAESITPLVQLVSEDEEIQKMCSECEADEIVQRLPFEEVQTKKESSKKSTPANFEKKLSTSKGGGSQLNEGTKAEMESGFGANFSNVRIHTDSNAVKMSQEIGAHAFTNGNDIYFNQGKYNPNSNSGKHLLAHELTHTIQQGGSSSSTQKKIQRWPAWADSAASWVVDTASSAASSVADGAAWVGGQIVDGAEWVGNQVTSGVDWVGNKISAAASWVMEQLNSAINSGTNFLNEKWENIQNFGTTAFDDIKNGFSGLASFITSPMTSMIAALSNMNADVLQNIWNVLKAGGNALLSGINTIVSGVLGVGEALWETVSGFIDGIFDTIDGLFDNTAFNLLPDSIKSGVRLAFNGLQSLWSRVSSFWTNLWERLTSFANEIIVSIQSFVENVINFGIEQVISLVRKLKEVYDFVINTFTNPEETIAPFVEAIAAKINNEGPAKSQELGNQLTHENYPGEISQSEDNGSVQRVVIDGEERTTASLGEVLEGVVFYLAQAWEKLDILNMLWITFRDMFWPPATIRAIGQQFSTLWNDEWATAYNSLYMPRNLLDDPLDCLHDIWSNYLILLDFPLALWRTINNILGLLMGYITILLMLIGAIIGGAGGAIFFGVAIPPGIIAGAGAGLALMGPIGLALAASIVGAETNSVSVIMLRLFTANQVCEKRQVDIMQSVASIVTAAVTIVVAVLLALLAKLISMIAEFLKGAPKTTPVRPPVPEPVPAPLPEPVPLPVPQPAQPVPQPAQPTPQPLPPNVIPFPSKPQPVPVDPAIPIAAKFEDGENGAAIAQLVTEENEESDQQNNEKLNYNEDRNTELDDPKMVQTARIDNINPDACEKKEDDELPETDVRHNMDGEGRADYVIADPLTRIPGNTRGSDPTDDDTIPKGWPHVRSFDLFYNDGILSVTNWVKFHLLHNKNMHGPGVGYNLVPAHKQDNSNYYSGFEKNMVNRLGPTSNGIYSYEIKVNNYREATEEAPYLSDFPVSLTINAKEYNDYHKDRSKTTSIFSGNTFTFNISPLKSRSEDEVPSFIINHAGEPNLKKFTRLSATGNGARVIAKINASSVSDFTRQLVELPPTSRDQFETRLGYLRDVRDSIGPFYRNEVLEANVFLLSENENVAVVRGELSQKIVEYETLMRENNHITLKAKFDEVVAADNGLTSNDVKVKIMEKFKLSRSTINKYLAGTQQPNPLVIRDIIAFLNTL